MLKQFYEKTLPTQGVYCVAAIKDGRIRHHFAKTLDQVLEHIDTLKELDGVNIFTARGTFKGFSRKGEDCIFHRSFFLDLDVGEAVDKDGNPTLKYESKEAALSALDELVSSAELPPPVIMDSGGGIHAYWPFDRDIPADEWKTYAELFKALCIAKINIDPVVVADLARIMRSPATYNHKFTPKVETFLISDEIPVYDWDEMKEFLGAPTPKRNDDVLTEVSKGLDEDTRAILKLDNFPKTFDTLAAKSVTDSGCAQIKNILVNAATLPEPLWWAGLSIAKFCDDGATAIHKMSEDYPGYNYEATEEKANRYPAPRTCEWFINNYPAICQGCEHKGKITSPIQLAKEFRPAPAADKEDSVWQDPNPEKIPDFPEFLRPFMRGQNGGIYFQPAPVTDKNGKRHVDDPILILANDLFPLVRMVSPHDGECLQMRLMLPKDGHRDFLLPMKNVYAKESLKAIMAYNGVFFSSSHDQHLMNYIVKWGQYMQTTDKALQMRMQMGWTVERSDEANWVNKHFVVGTQEIMPNGEVINAPSSPFVNGLSKHLKTQGTYERWRESMDYLNRPGFELHAFAALCGFASPLMSYTSTPGVTINLMGKSGNAKTGAMYAALSVFGNPKNLSVMRATDNGLTQRYLGLHSIMLGLDEVGDKDPKEIGPLIHNVSHGKGKIRVQASVNAEREHELPASLIALLTSNHSLYGKLESLKNSPDGEAARLIELLVHRPELLQQDARLGQYIFDAFNYNYGFAGPMFIKLVMKLGDNYILERIQHWSDRFLQDFGAYTEYRFYQNLIGAVFTACEIANEGGIIAFDQDRIYHEAVRSLIMIRDNVIKVNKTDYESILGDFINKNMGNMLVIKDGKVSMEPRGQIVGRIVSDEELLQISKSEFKKYLAEQKISTREFEFEMKEKKVLIADKKGRLTTGWKTAIHVDPAYLYWFKMPAADKFYDDDTGT
jgi:hypothetical protein